MRRKPYQAIEEHALAAFGLGPLAIPKKGSQGVVRFPNGKTHRVQVNHVNEDGSCLTLCQVRKGILETFEHRMLRGKDGVYRTPVADGVFEATPGWRSIWREKSNQRPAGRDTSLQGRSEPVEATDGSARVVQRDVKPENVLPEGQGSLFS